MELSLIRSLMDKSFYDDHRGARCPDRLFSKDVRKIKQSIDSAMDKYERTVSPDEVEALFMSDNPTLTTAQKQSYSSLFLQIKKESPMGGDIAQEVLSKLFQQVVGEDVANIGFDMVNGTATTMEKLRLLLEQYGDDFTPNLNIQWEDISIETLMAKAELEAKWAFNIAPITRKIEGVSGGQLIEVGARPNTGKTSFHASIIASPNGFASQGARCIVLCNEEPPHRVGARYLTAATGMSAREVRNDMQKAKAMYEPVKRNILLKEGSRTGKAAEADLMFLIAKSPSVEGQEEESPLRHVNIVKNKLNGWHGMVNCELNYLTARYEG